MPLQSCAYEAAVFDLDGLLFDTERIYMEATAAALTELGFHPDPKTLNDLIGLSDSACDALLLETFGPALPLTQYLDRYRRLRDGLLAPGVPLRSGAREIVETLSGLDLPLAVATSASERTAYEYLSAALLLDHFDCIVSPGDRLRPKPAPDLYLAAARGLRKPPEACLALEDSAPGIRAAHEAGLDVVAVTDPSEIDARVAEMCVYVATDLFAATDLIIPR